MGYLGGEWGCYASPIASAAQLSTTLPSCGTPCCIQRVVGDQVLAGKSECSMGEQSKDAKDTCGVQFLSDDFLYSAEKSAE